MDLFSFPLFSSSSESTPMSVSFDLGELEAYLNNPLTSSMEQPSISACSTLSDFPLPPHEFTTDHHFHHRPTFEEIRHHHHGEGSNLIDYILSNEEISALNPITTNLGNSQNESPGPAGFQARVTEDDKKKRKRRPEPMTDICRICGDIAPPHNHYGAIACFSCRAFFGRTVHKGTQERFRCVRGNPDESGKCLMTKATRTHCQFCRYHGCLSAGMKPSYVTTAEERLQKKKNSKRGKKLLIKLHIKEEASFCDVPAFRVIADVRIPLKSSGAYPKMSFTIEQNRRVEHRIQCRNFTWHSITVGMNLILELIRVGSECLAPSNDVEIEMYFNENDKFGEGRVDDFSLKSSSNFFKDLCQRADPVLHVNVSSVFSGRVGLKEQLLESMGSKDYVVQHNFQSTHSRDPLVSVKQVFSNPWSENGLSAECANKFDKSLEKLEKLNLDRKIECLMSVIPFFEGTDDPEETILLSKIQEEINHALFQHVLESLGPKKGNNVFSKIMSLIVDLQEVVTLCRKTAVDFKIAPLGSI